jgi:hypothetical protein
MSDSVPEPDNILNFILHVFNIIFIYYNKYLTICLKFILKFITQIKDLDNLTISMFSLTININQTSWGFNYYNL